MTREQLIRIHAEQQENSAISYKAKFGYAKYPALCDHETTRQIGARDWQWFCDACGASGCAHSPACTNESPCETCVATLNLPR